MKFRVNIIYALGDGRLSSVCSVAISCACKQTHSTEGWPSNKGMGGGTPKFLVTLLVLLLHNQLSVILPR